MKRLFFLIALLTGLSPLAVAAQQYTYGPNTLVMGAAADAALCGVDLLDTNPAAVNVDCGAPAARFRMLFPPTLAVGWYSDGAHSEILDNFGEVSDGLDGLDFSGIPPEDRQAILDAIPADGWALRGHLTAPLVALVTGDLGISIDKTALVASTLPKDVVELVLEGYEDGRDDYDIDTFDASVFSLTRYTVGWAAPVRPDLRVGVSATLHTAGVAGHYRATPVVVDSVADTAEFSLIGGFAGGGFLDGSIFSFRTPDGLGYSIDVGGRWHRSGFTASLAVENLLSGMTWKDRTITVETQVTASEDGITTEVVRDTFETAVAEVRPLREGLEAYSPALRIRSAAAYQYGIATVAYGRVDEPGDGLLYATGGGWDVGLSLQPWQFLALNGSVGQWRDATTVGGALSLRSGNFLFQAGARHSDVGQQLALSIALLR